MSGSNLFVGLLFPTDKLYGVECRFREIGVLVVPGSLECRKGRLVAYRPEGGRSLSFDFTVFVRCKKSYHHFQRTAGGIAINSERPSGTTPNKGALIRKRENEWTDGVSV